MAAPEIELFTYIGDYGQMVERISIFPYEGEIPAESVTCENTFTDVSAMIPSKGIIRSVTDNQKLTLYCDPFLYRMNFCICGDHFTITKENAPIMKTIVSLVCGMLTILVILFMDFPQDVLKISNFFGMLQHNMVNILAICFLLTIWGVSFYSIDFYSDPEKQRYYNSPEYREQQMEKIYKFTENVQKFINYLKTLFHKNN